MHMYVCTNYNMTIYKFPLILQINKLLHWQELRINFISLLSRGMCKLLANNSNASVAIVIITCSCSSLHDVKYFTTFINFIDKFIKPTCLTTQSVEKNARTMYIIMYRRICMYIHMCIIHVLSTAGAAYLVTFNSLSLSIIHSKW